MHSGGFVLYDVLDGLLGWRNEVITRPTAEVPSAGRVCAEDKAKKVHDTNYLF